MVWVWIRHSAGVRGVCHGRLIAFDKHWNVVRYCKLCVLAPGSYQGTGLN